MQRLSARSVRRSSGLPSKTMEVDELEAGRPPPEGLCNLRGDEALDRFPTARGLSYSMPYQPRGQANMVQDTRGDRSHFGSRRYRSYRYDGVIT